MCAAARGAAHRALRFPRRRHERLQARRAAWELAAARRLCVARHAARCQPPPADPIRRRPWLPALGAECSQAAGETALRRFPAAHQIAGDRRRRRADRDNPPATDLGRPSGHDRPATER